MTKSGARLKTTTALLVSLTVWTVMGVSPPAAQTNIACDGYVSQVLSGNPYCDAGARAGFGWTGSTSWLCSANANMDALIITAYTTNRQISVRAPWPDCTSHATGAVPDHIRFLDGAR